MRDRVTLVVSSRDTAGSNVPAPGGSVPFPTSEAVLEVAVLAAVPGIAHGFETRRGDLAEVAPKPIARVHQVHGGTVLSVPAGETERQPFLEAEPEARPEADALISDQAGVTVAVSVADCLPILIADAERRAVAAVHGGWRSLAAGIVEKTIEAMAAQLGTRAGDLFVGIGPGIGPCCFEVGTEVIETFEALGYGDPARVPDPPAALLGGAHAAATPKPHADLVAVARTALTGAGVREDRVDCAGLCTKCNSNWLWSYRADGDAAGRMLCGIGLVDEARPVGSCQTS